MSRFGREVGTATTYRIESSEWGLRITGDGHRRAIYFGCPRCGNATRVDADGFLTADGLTLNPIECRVVHCGARFHAMFMGWRERNGILGVPVTEKPLNPAMEPWRTGTWMHHWSPDDPTARLPSGTHHPALCQADGYAE